MFNDVNEAINYIETRKRFRPKTTLDNMRRLCQLFGNPQEKLKFIHVTGTNGKGSTCLFLTNILLEANYNVGTFVSPYITCFNERIEYNKNYISDKDLLDIANYIMSKKEMFDNDYLMEPSFFEMCTLISFIYFERMKPDIVVLEVGMGGTLDSTNIITPLVSVITNVKKDHMATLGNTVEEICENKLGIVKTNKPLFTIYDEKLHHLMVEKTKEMNSPLFEIKKEDIKNIQIDCHHTIFDYLDYHNVEIKLLAKYQTENASLAIEVCKYLCMNCLYQITNDNIRTGLLKTFWPGRLEVVSTNPLIILDGAHNIDGITRLYEFLESVKKNRKLKIYFAVSSDKEKDQMIKILEPIADEIIFTKFQYRRSDDANYLYSLSNHPHKRVLENVGDVEKEIEKEKDSMILCCGSLYFISELRKLLKPFTN